MFLFKETLRDLSPTQPDALVWNESSMLKERIEMFNRQMPVVLIRLTLEPLERPKPAANKVWIVLVRL